MFSTSGYQVPAASSKTTAPASSAASRKTGQNLHQHSRTGIPHLSNLQQVRKTVYSQFGPPQQQSGSSHHRKKTASALQSTATQHLTVPLGSAVEAVKLNQSGHGQANNHLGNQVDTTQNQSSSLTVPASPLSSRHTHHNVTQNNAILNTYTNNNQPIMDDSTAMSAGQSTTTTTMALAAGPNLLASAAALLKQPQSSSNHHYSKHQQQHAKFVTHETLLSTVKALVGYFEEKIQDLANSTKATTRIDLVANKESSTEIIERISQMLQMPLRTEAVIQPQKNPGKHNNANSVQNHQQIKTQKAGGNNSNKENAIVAPSDVEGHRHSSAKKIRMMSVEEIEQLTMAQVPPGELGSAASVKAGHTSMRSLNPPNSQNDRLCNKSSRSKKKNEKKSDNQHSKAPATQPFKANNQVLNSQRPSTTQSQGGHHNKKATGAKSSGHLNQKRASANSSRVSSTQNLFKPNPNFANSKRQFQGAVGANQQQSVQQLQHSQNATAAPQKRQASLDSAAVAATKEQQYSVISGEAGHDLDGDSGILPNISYRNHFQDIYSNSSLLKSIGREEEDSGHLNFITHQQLTEDHRVARDTGTGGRDEKKTPGLGAEASSKLKSSSQQRQQPESGPFALANPMKYNTSLSNVTSTFKIEKHEEEAEEGTATQQQCDRRTVFDQSQDEIVNPADVTPEKAQDNLLQLLSNLEGLTPAGLEHLMETQDKLASTTVVKRPESSHLTELDLQSRKHSEQPNFSSSGVRRASHQSHHHHHSQSRPQSIPRQRANTGSSTARQALKFVDTSDQQSIPSPAPVVNYTQSHATLEPPSSRFLDAPAAAATASAMNTSRGGVITARGAGADHHHQSTSGGGGNITNGNGIQKRLVYESLANESGKQHKHQSSVNQPQTQSSTRQAVTPRVSHGGGAHPERPSQQSTNTRATGTATRRQKSTKNGTTAASQSNIVQLQGATGLAGANAGGASTTSQVTKSLGGGGGLPSQRGAQQLANHHAASALLNGATCASGSNQHALLNKPHSVLEQRRQQSNNATRNHASNHLGGGNHHHHNHHHNTHHRSTHQSYKTSTTSQTVQSNATSGKQGPAAGASSGALTSRTTAKPSQTVTSPAQQVPASMGTSELQSNSITATATVANNSNNSEQQRISFEQAAAASSKINNASNNVSNKNQQQSSTRPIQQQQIMMPPLNDHFMAKKLITPTSSSSGQAAMLTSRIQQQHQQLKAFEAATLTGQMTSRTLTRTNSQSRYEDRFKQLTQLVEKHQSHSVEQQIELQGGATSVHHHHHQQRHFTEQVRRIVTHQTAKTTAATTPQLVDSKSTESTVVERETVFKIGIESEPLSSEEFYGKGDGDEENSVTKAHLNGNNNERSYTSEKVASKEMGMLVQQKRRARVKAAAIDVIDDENASQGEESIGSLERQIQQIVLSRDLLQEMDIDIKQVDMNNAAGSVLEPSEEQARCLMLRQGLVEFNQTSGIGMNTAQELEPSLPPDQLNLSGAEDDEVQHMSPPRVHGATQFDHNTSNISFG